MSHILKCSAKRRQKYRQEGYWGDVTLADYWNMAVMSAPEKTAVSDAHKTTFNYAEIDDAAKRIASFLIDAGIQPGDFVSVQLPSWTEFVLIYGACLKVGAVINPVLPNYRICELEFILNKCESKVLFIPESYRRYQFFEMIDELKIKVPSLQQVVVVEKENSYQSGITLNQILQEHMPLATQCKISSDDLAAVLFTSGTENRPKGVMLTHNNIIACEKAFNSTFNITFQDVTLLPAPIAHATGFLHGIVSPLMVGAKTVLQDVFDSNCSVSLINEHRCTYMLGATPFVDGVLKCLENEPLENFSSLRFFLCGGAAIPQGMGEKSLRMGIKLISVYGSTESAPHTATHPDDPIDKIMHTDGKALPGIEVRVVDCNHNPVGIGQEGQEASRGPNVFSGYLKEPELTRKVLDEDGWYYSGDLCTMDKDGYIKITGRIKDVIVRGGENISGKELENILLLHPQVKEVAVVAMPDPRLGEKACAYVVLENPDPLFTFKEMVCFFESQQVAKYKFPERLEIVSELIKTASGKVQKNLLRQDVKAKLEAEKCLTAISSKPVKIGATTRKSAIH